MSKRVREQGNPPPPSYCVARWGARHLVLLGVVGSKASQCWWRFSLVFMRILFFSVCSFVLIILMMTWVGWLFVYFFLLGFIIVGYRSFVFNFSSFSLYSLPSIFSSCFCFKKISIPRFLPWYVYFFMYIVYSFTTFQDGKLRMLLILSSNYFPFMVASPFHLCTGKHSRQRNLFLHFHHLSPLC